MKPIRRASAILHILYIRKKNESHGLPLITHITTLNFEAITSKEVPCQQILDLHLKTAKTLKSIKQLTELLIEIKNYHLV